MFCRLSHWLGKEYGSTSIDTRPPEIKLIMSETIIRESDMESYKSSNEQCLVLAHILQRGHLNRLSQQITKRPSTSHYVHRWGFFKKRCGFLFVTAQHQELSPREIRNHSSRGPWSLVWIHPKNLGRKCTKCISSRSANDFLCYEATRR